MQEPENQRQTQIQKTNSTVPVRGDGFDIGKNNNVVEYEPPSNFEEIFESGQLSQALNLTETQAENVRSLIVGAGTSGIHRVLRKHFGDEISGMIGGLLSGYVAKKIMDKGK